MSDLGLEPVSEGAVTLRDLRASDLPATLSWRNDPRSRPWFHSDAVIEWESHLRWFRSYLGKAEDHVFVLEDEGRPVAQVSLYRIDGDSAEFGRLLVDPETRGKGYGGIASRLCLRLADEVLGLRIVHLEVKRTNSAAIKIYEALGFGIRPSATTPEDSVYMVRER